MRILNRIIMLLIVILGASAQGYFTDLAHAGDVGRAVWAYD